jgi:predicted AlkP superfamily pyrophosphatase or phosphodiesterase
MPSDAPGLRGSPRCTARPAARVLAGLALAALAVLAVGCGGERGGELVDRLRGAEAGSPVILVSLDGFHPDYLDRGLTPTLQRLADDGVRARWLIPSFPTKTFPNHYSIVTGLVPDRHGIVDNTMVDPQLGRFSLQRREAVGDGRWWGGEPVWVGARRAGLRTATVFWPGSEAAIGGVRPNDWLAYDAAMSAPQRVDQVLAWLGRGPRQRPHFVTLYLDGIDIAGHREGPDSTRVDAALGEADAAIARLLDGLDRLGLRAAVNLVIVSDHGMAALEPGQVLVLDELVDPALVEVVSLSEIFSVNPRPGQAEAVAAALLPARPGLDCYRREQLPPDWSFGSHPRVPAIVCQLHEGWRISRRDAFNPWQDRVAGNRGAHGYDPGTPSMRGLFIGHGPAFRSGLLVEPFQNIHVYPLLTALLGIEAADSDGDPAVTAALLRTPAAR